MSVGRVRTRRVREGGCEMSGLLKTHRLWAFAATLAAMLYGFICV